MSKKLLTIAIPTYNGGNALIEAVESCKYVDISESDFEVLVVDNCSSDNSIEILETDYSGFEPLRIVKNSVNVGRIPNWNKCITHAEGKYLLYLFANDLISHDNNVKETLVFFDKYQESSLCSVPWIVSDFKMKNMFSAPQYHKRTPGVGAFNSEPHVKSILESGKLPFVCLQSNFLRTSDIYSSGLEFDDSYSITSDGIFLSKLAVFKKQVCFFNKHSIIWRQDAPNRLHSNVKYDDHIKQFFNTFIIINNEVSMGRKGVAKALANYSGSKYFWISLIKSRRKADVFYSFKLLSLWFSLTKNGEINYLRFLYYSTINLILTVKKIPTFFKLLINS
jgi:glycosyltransferase involved in cell wall biosynthesis